VSLEYPFTDERGLREKRKEIELERKNILLLSVAEDRPLTKEEVEKIFKLNKDHHMTAIKIIGAIILKCLNAF